MAKADSGPQGKRKNTPPAPAEAKPEGGETTAAYFRRILTETPKLLNAGSNKETLDRWLQDHPGYVTVPNNIKANLSNIKSVLRQKRRQWRARKDAAATGPDAPAAVPRRAPKGLEMLEEHIDDGLTL